MSSSSLQTRYADEAPVLELSQTPNHAHSEEKDYIEDGHSKNGEINETQEEKPPSHDPYMVVFRPDDPSNPKVRDQGHSFIDIIDPNISNGRTGED